MHRPLGRCLPPINLGVQFGKCKVVSGCPCAGSEAGGHLGWARSSLGEVALERALIANGSDSNSSKNQVCYLIKSKEGTARMP